MLEQRLVRLLIIILALISTIISASAIQYQYDSQGRLLNVVYDESNWMTFGYDDVGNRLTGVITGSADPDTIPNLYAVPSTTNLPSSDSTPTIDITNIGGGTLNWTASITSGPPNWLSISSGHSGTNNGTVNLLASANPDTSSRNATVSIEAPEATNGLQNIVFSQSGAPNTPEDLRLIVQENDAIVLFHIIGNDLFYTTEPSNNCLLKTIPLAGGQATTLTTDAYTTEGGNSYGITGFHIVDDMIYGGYGGYQGHNIFKLPITGGQHENLINISGGSYLTTTNSHIYYNQSYSQTKRMDHSGNNSQNIVDNNWIRGRAFDSESVYYYEYNSQYLRKFNLDNHNVENLASIGTDCMVFLDDTYVYTFQTSNLRRVAKSGGDLIVLSSEPDTKFFCADNTYVYGANNLSSLVRIPRDGGPEENLYEMTSDEIKGICYSNDSLYLLTFDNTNWSIYCYSTQTTEVPQTIVPDITLIKQIYPNPFNPQTNIEFGLTADSIVSLNIYDIQGKLVRVLANEVMTAGWHEKVWNGCGEDGQAMASGVYFVHLEAGDVIQSKKLMLIK